MPKTVRSVSPEGRPGISQAEFALKSRFAKGGKKSLLLDQNLETTRWPVQKISTRLSGSERQRTFSEKS